MTRFIRPFLVLALVLGVVASHASSPRKETGDFTLAAEKARRQLEESLAELAALRERMAEETLPLSRKLSDLENELVEVRLKHQQTTRLLDSRTLDLTNLRSEIKSREEESLYLSNLLGEYIRNLESRLHIAEVQRYREAFETARLALENSSLSIEEVYQAQVSLVLLSLDRLHEAGAGVSFEGSAVDSGGLLKPGTFALVGPAALFVSDDGGTLGVAEQRLGSLEPSVVPFGNPEDAEAAREVLTQSTGLFPLDPTLGSAHKIEATQETLAEHVRKGGPVMVPIFALAGFALFVAVTKWLSMIRLRAPSPKRLRAVLEAVSMRDAAAVKQRSQAVGGPVGRMLESAADHLDEPRELLEELFYEKVLESRLALEKYLPFIAISAASAPLLGLLGTVTGIINTFKLITVFGSGDVKTLSGGISEALITTEFGLIVAIPSLLIHAFLSRKARVVLGHMEKAAVAFVNQIGKNSIQMRRALDVDEEATSQSAREVSRTLAREPQPAIDLIN